MKSGPIKLDTTTDSAASVSAPVIVVLIVLMLGATIFLWRSRYIRRRTAFITMTVLLLALVAASLSLYMARV